MVEENIKLRKCRCCREYKILNSLNFVKRTSENGWRGFCRICYNKQIRRKQEVNNTERLRSLKYLQTRKEKDPFGFLLQTARGNAKKKFREFSITKEILIEKFNLQEGKCFYTGLTLNKIIGFPDSISIDRIDSTLGYIPENIVLCTYKVNVMKNDLSFEQLISICKNIIKTHSNDREVTRSL